MTATMAATDEAAPATTRAVRGVLVVEGVQTGDGRLIVDGAVTWSELPLPLAWLREEQHGDLMTGAPQIGTIDTITRGPNGVIEWTGTIDAANADGAEVIRRMDGGTGPLGARFGISIDPDDWAMELVVTDPDAMEDGAILLASGAGPLPECGVPCGLLAAAGDGEVPEGEVIFENAMDAMLSRFTRLRIRGATACAVAAFAEAYMELADAEPAADEAPAEELPVAAAGAPAFVRDRSWFAADFRPAEVVPVAIEGRHIWGYTALRDTCHIGRAPCVTPPMSASGYRFFHTGSLNVNGASVPVGRITMGTGHASLDAGHTAAVAHYDDTGWTVANVICGEDANGIWYSGSLCPTTTDEQAEALLACGGVSGDWRPIAGSLELVALLAVNVPGFPVPRPAVTAAAMPARAQAEVRMVGDQIGALVGAGVAALARDHRSGGVARPLTARIPADLLRRVEMCERQLATLAPLRPLVAERLQARIKGV
jgi:hypothetical protein